MTVKTEKELTENQRALWLKAMAAIELRNFGYAISPLQNFKTGAEVLDGPAVVAPRRNCETARQQEELLQHLDRADRGDESAARESRKRRTARLR